MYKITECAVMPASTSLNTTVGVGNVTPPQSVAFTGAEQSGTDCIGSGDLLGGSAKQTKKYGIYKKRGNKKIAVQKGLDYKDAVDLSKKLNEKGINEEYKIYEMA